MALKTCRCANGHKFTNSEAQNRKYRCWDGQPITCGRSTTDLLPVLRRSATGRAVATLNASLRRIGFGVSEGRDFDHYTEAAVVSFQYDHELTVDGIVGERTWAALDASTDAPDEPSPVFDVLLDVPYFTQRDNDHHPNGTCNVTCLAMALAYHGVKQRKPSMQFEDELLTELWTPAGKAYFAKNFPSLQRLNPRNVHGMLVWLAQRYGVSARFETNATWAAIFEAMRAKRPVIVSGKFTGSGHTVLLVGITCRNDLVVHDPYGDWNRRYKPEESGAYRIYTFEDLDDILNAGPDKKWAHFIEP